MGQKHLFIAVAIACASIFTGCDKLQDIDITEENPAVTIALKGSPFRNSFEVTFTPNDKTIVWDYACAKDGKRENFMDGTMPGIVRVRNAQKIDIEFTGIDAQSTYTVYARAFDEDGNMGPVAMLLVRTMADWADSKDLKGEQVYVTNNSAGFKMTGTLNFYKFEYAVGTAADKEAFENGTLAGIRECPEMEYYVANFFGLDANADLVFYYRAYDRANRPTKVNEIPFRTAAEGAGPQVAFNVKNIDVYKGEFTFQANSHCNNYIYSVSPVGGAFDIALDAPFAAQGDAEKVLNNFIMSGTAFAANGQAEENFINYTPPMDDPIGVLANYYPPALLAGVEFYAYVGMYDAQGTYVGTQRFSYSTPEYDDSLQPATVTATAVDLNANGATLKFTAGAGTLGFFFDTVDADTFDNAVDTGIWQWYNYDGTPGQQQPYTENFLRDMFFSRPDSSQGFFWRYCNGTSPADFVDSSMVPGTKFYIAVCPMNANGASDPDWGRLWISEKYTTPAQ